MGETALDTESIEGILTLAEAEARRWHHRAAGVEHVAYVMATAYPREFAVRFGRAGRGLIEDVLRWRAPAGGLALARRTLEASATVEDALVALHDLVSPPDVVVEDVERTAHERWLVLLIEDRFRSYRRRRDNMVLDELYVLIATLKVVGFPDAHEAMKTRLRAVHR